MYEAPTDLILIYSAVTSAFFTAWPPSSSAVFSPEEIAHATYYKILEENSHSQNPSRPLLYTRVLGPFSYSETDQAVASLKKSLYSIDSIEICSYLNRSYIVLRAPPWIASVIDSFPKDLLPMSHPSVFTLSLQHKPNSFPDEIIMSRSRSHTLCILNIYETEEDLLQEFSHWSIQKVFTIPGRAFIRLDGRESASQMYKELTGCRSNGRSLFLMFYPECLSDANLFL